MKEDIIVKIKNEFSRGITEEKQLVFVLSKIRKIVEIKNLQNKFRFLNFYCNWALHSQIDRTNLIKDFFLVEGEANESEQVRFQLHNQFFEELIDFYNKYIEKKNFTAQEIEEIRHILYKILEDTPLIITEEKKYQYVIKADVSYKGKEFAYYKYEEYSGE